MRCFDVSDKAKFSIGKYFVSGNLISVTYSLSPFTMSSLVLLSLRDLHDIRIGFVLLADFWLLILLGEKLFSFEFPTHLSKLFRQ